MSGVFLNCFPPYSLRSGLPLNQELIDLASLASQLARDPLCLWSPRMMGHHHTCSAFM